MRAPTKEEAALHKEAYRVFNNAKARGDIVPQGCEKCDTHKPIYGHHEDYSKPLEVRWLCMLHHKERHAEMAPRDPRTRTCRVCQHEWVPRVQISYKCPRCQDFWWWREKPEFGEHSCAHLDEAREKECEICLSRMP